MSRRTKTRASSSLSSLAQSRWVTTDQTTTKTNLKNS